MSDIDKSRPLTRRELRLREMAASGVDVADQSDDSKVQHPSAEPDRQPGTDAEHQPGMLATELFEVDVSLHDESGRLRSRREMRVLREQARAAAIEEMLPATEPIDVITGEIDIELEESAAQHESEDVEDVVEALEVAEAAEDAEVELDTDESSDATQYSFPDIAPLDEAPSVFDDPAIRMSADEAEGSGDFDELISRAVSQEGASQNGTSALILPAMPTTDSLSGPIGETGEILFTGSISLPRSLGETGGHSALHDVLEADQLEELSPTDPMFTTGHMAPVSAAKAVSAQSGTGAMVSDAAKDKSKLPAVLISVGGVLVVVAVGLVVWAAVSGLFG